MEPDDAPRLRPKVPFTLKRDEALCARVIEMRNAGVSLELLDLAELRAVLEELRAVAGLRGGHSRVSHILKSAFAFGDGSDEPDKRLLRILLTHALLGR